MHTETRSVYIDASPADVWNVVADFGGVGKYNPNVATAFSTSDANGGVGATRHCDLTFSGASVEERIEEWNEGTSMRVRIVDGKRVPPFAEALADISVAADGSGTRVSMSLSYSMKYGPIGVLMDRLVIRRQYAKAVTLILAGLKHHVETGEEVSGVRVDTAPVAV